MMKRNNWRSIGELGRTLIDSLNNDIRGKGGEPDCISDREDKDALDGSPIARGVEAPRAQTDGKDRGAKSPASSEGTTARCVSASAEPSPATRRPVLKVVVSNRRCLDMAFPTRRPSEAMSRHLWLVTGAHGSEPPSQSMGGILPPRLTT